MESILTYISFKVLCCWFLFVFFFSKQDGLSKVCSTFIKMCIVIKQCVKFFTLMKTFCDILFGLPKKRYAMVHINGEYNAPVNNP